ncbi:MAG: citramalate synthase [SAR202 cluster bacterium]|nr:citramalate synthase [SAR202 cluster bacterium]MDP6714244.1 citramalate synthase [SAR202 cluster bacterium]
MPGQHPKVIYTEEGMREGMQIEDANIPVSEKVALLDALSETGLKRIVVGSFVSPRYTPQMERIDEIVEKFTPKEGVTYTALALNQRGIERAREYSPPLTIERGSGIPSLSCHMCDVFARRNTNRTQMQEMENWPRVIAQAQEQGATEAGIGTNATFGSNFLGDFTVDMVMRFMEKQHLLWDEVGIPVTSVSVGDPMGWCHPTKVTEIFQRVKEQWPEVVNFRAHLHNSRGMATASMYAAIDTLGPEDTLNVDGTIGGFGGCPYCGNGRATGMVATEDAMHMMDGMGIDMGIDMDRLIDCVWMVEEMLGRQLWGHVSRTGTRPMTVDRMYDMNAPFVETLEQVKHFKLGPSAYEGGIYPWRAPIESPYRERVEQGLPPYDVDGDWPWSEDFFPKPSG